jgi:hypothetical protein
MRSHSLRFWQTTDLWQVVAALVLAIFLAVQTFGLVHETEHGFAAHKHHGKDCAIHLYCERTQLADPPAASAIVLLASPIHKAAEVRPGVPAGIWVARAYPRGPPVLLLT